MFIDMSVDVTHSVIMGPGLIHPLFIAHCA